ncbi:MAG: hypothetical protein CMK44_06325 [Porticoccus sp.]|jgi:formylglycine-generating enzyme required for sulfatase activity|nr:hypothetical protein [Porticoccus sp.]
MKEKDNKNASSEQPSFVDEKLVPINFKPIARSSKRSKILFSPIKVTIGLAFLISLSIIWFLLTAKSVVVTIAPTEAKPKVNIYGGLSFQLSDNYLVRPGDYTLKALAPGYFDLNHTFTVNEKNLAQLELTMKKKPGHLRLTSKPSGSEIIMGSEVVGLTPFNIKSIQSGEYEINLSLPRYKTKKLDVKIDGLDIQQDIHIDLEPDWGFLELDSSPSGAEIKINDRYIGNTPFSVPILSTGEIVSLSYDGYKTWKKKLSIDSGKTKIFPKIELELADGTLDLTTIPSGATITLDGEYKGNTPLTLYLNAKKEHDIAIFLNGYLTQKKSISLVSGEKRKISVDMNPIMGAVTVVVSPKDSSVWINEEPQGTGNREFQLPSHPQLIEVKKTGYASYKKFITPQPKFEQIIDVQLLTEEQAYWASVPKEIITTMNHKLKFFRPINEFFMGAPRQEIGRRANEVLRKIIITRPFYIATKEVTNEQFSEFQKHSSRHFKGKTLNKPKQPVVNISWEQAALYCNWLSKKDGLVPFYTEENGKLIGTDTGGIGYRLPTEAEWSWVARSQNIAVESETLFTGYPPKNKSGNFADKSASDILSSVIPLFDDGYPTTSIVGSFDENEKGLYDLQGNVSEWVNDFYEIKFNLSGTAEIDPMGPKSGKFKTIRGSSWRDSSLSSLRLTFRDMANSPTDDVGFRIARFIQPIVKK